MNKIKVFSTVVMTTLMSWLGVLAVPVLMLVACNLIDYITGLFASPFRQEKISSYKGIKGIIKKVCMWLLVVIGVFMDTLIQYAIDTAGIDIKISFVVATTVAIWLVVNEIISILENLVDIGVKIPPFLMPIVKYIKHQVEEKAEIIEDKGDEDVN